MVKQEGEEHKKMFTIDVFIKGGKFGRAWAEAKRGRDHCSKRGIGEDKGVCINK